jgi:WD40 repeat protein/tRNA A-37 threonylcarbamoyl transferase component Bud32
MIAFSCPGCGKSLKVKDDLAGKKGKCPHCQQPVAVPAGLAPQSAPSRSEGPAEPRTLPPAGPPQQTRAWGPGRPGPAEAERVTRGGGEPPAHTIAPGAVANPEHFDFLAPAEQPDELGRLGNYRVLRILGAGGMGVVFQAEDLTLKRKVALKAMLPALAASETAKQRFVREAQTAAAIEHDHIVPIFQVGEDRGVPFIAMPLLKGEPLDQRLQRQPTLPVAEVLRIGREAAKGLAAAHDAGLIHRDVKPANLWLEGDEGRVKILDFGLARGTADNAQLTQQGAIIGTPSYMAPEQASGEKVDGRCDLFSLGCVLYRLATGVLPFKGTDVISTLMAVATEEPRSPADLNPALPPALSDLILELLAKKPEARPASAWVVIDALTAIERQRTQTVTARPARPVKEAPTEQVKVRVRRRGHKRRRNVLVVSCVAAGVVAALAIVLGVVIALKTRRGNEEVSDARRQPPVADVPPPVRPDVHPVPLPATGPPLDGLRPELIPAAERFAWQPKELVAVLGEHRQRSWGNVWEVAYTPDGKTVVSRGGSDTLYLWEAATLRLRAHLQGHPDNITAMALSPNGRRLLTGGGHRDGVVRLWDLDTGQLLRRFEGRHGLEVTRLAFSPDGRRALSSSQDSLVKLWDVETGKAIHTLAGHGSWVWDVVFLPGGQRALSGGEGKGILLWDLASGKSTSPLADPAVSSFVTLLPDGHRVLSRGRDRTLRLWDVSTGKELHSFKGFPGDVHKAKLSPDGRLALVPCNEECWLFDVEARRQLGHFGRGVWGAAFSPDGRRILYGGRDRVLHLWDIGGRREVGLFEGHRQAIHSVAFSADGRQAVSGADDNTVRHWDVATGKEIHPVEGPTGWCTSVAFSPDGRQLLSGNYDYFGRIWDLTGGKGGRLLQGHTGGIRRGAYSPDGRWALTTSADRTIRRWDVESGQEVGRYVGHADQVAGVAFCGDGSQAVSSSGDRTLHLWDVASGRKLRVLEGHTQWVNGLAVAARANRALSGSHDKTVRLWNLDTGKELHKLEGHKDIVECVALSPDGRTGLSGGRDHRMILWTELDSARPRAVDFPMWHTAAVWNVAFAPDGRTLASSGFDGRVILWETATTRKLQEWVLPGSVGSVAFSPDGRHLATGNGNGTAYILRLPVLSQKAEK